MEGQIDIFLRFSNLLGLRAKEINIAILLQERTVTFVRVILNVSYLAATLPNMEDQEKNK